MSIFRAIVLVLLLLLARLCAADEIALQIAVVAKDAPAQFAMQEEDGMQSIVFRKNQADGMYRVQVPRPKPETLAAAKKLSLEYRLVASWPDWKEQIFLKLQSRLPPVVAFKLYRNQNAFDDVALSQIESLGTDLESTIEKYCRARAFHLHWRLKRLPDYYSALRSARIWFDAAVVLATRPNSPFGMDRDVKKIMEDYETRARQDRPFNSRYRKYASAGYVTGMLDDVKTSEYAFVGTVSKLTAEGKYKEALDLNTNAISVLTEEPETVRKLVQKRQGVDLDLLRGNEAFLANKAGG